MKRVLNRGDGTLTIKNIPCRSEIRRKMKYLIEKIDEAETKVRAGREAEVELIELEEEFNHLCGLIKEEY